jgi:glycosyltransferase involved in cell wall biosynthesis
VLQDPSDAAPTFTIFTPTYNRAHVLGRVYRSLVAQTFRDFEWLVIDNASTDGTDALVEGWVRDAEITIRYLRNEVNIGHPGSWRRGIQEARGRLFVETRSADSLVPDALERLIYHWDSIPDDERSRFSAVTALAVDEHGQLNGTPFPRDVVDADSISIRFRHKVKGDKFGFQRLDVLRNVPIPQIPGYTGEIPARIVWRAIARHYKTRYVNERLRVYWQDQGPGLSRPLEGWVSAPGRVLDTQDLLNNDLSWLPSAPLTFFREAAGYVCSGWHAGRSPTRQIAELRGTGARLLWLAALPVGTAFYLIQRLAPRLGRWLPNP